MIRTSASILENCCATQQEARVQLIMICHNLILMIPDDSMDEWHRN